MNTEWFTNKYFKNRSSEFASDWIEHCKDLYTDMLADMEDVPPFNQFLTDCTTDLLGEHVNYDIRYFIVAVEEKVKESLTKDTLSTTFQSSNQTILVTLDFKFN